MYVALPQFAGRYPALGRLAHGSGVRSSRTQRVRARGSRPSLERRARRAGALPARSLGPRRPRTCAGWADEIQRRERGPDGRHPLGARAVGSVQPPAGRTRRSGPDGRIARTSRQAETRTGRLRRGQRVGDGGRERRGRPRRTRALRDPRQAAGRLGSDRRGARSPRRPGGSDRPPGGPAGSNGAGTVPGGANRQPDRPPQPARIPGDALPGDFPARR